MNEARPYASLSSGLLARKGSAKPAMRPQGYTHFEDLGWNDMGHGPAPEEPADSDGPEHVPSSIAALTPAPKQPKTPIISREEDDEDGEEAVFDAAGEETDIDAGDSPDEGPPVVAQQRAIAESFRGEEEEPIEAPAAEPRARRNGKAKIVPLPKRAVASVPAGRKAAFTLRLDSDRHLRLRLACAVTGRSAQQIVSGALDELLATIPEVETLASRVPAKAKRN